jgi:predicted hotdog family 3-hydroxylacyl-ACP dehydratase
MAVQAHWSELIPHAGAMRLLDDVKDWDDRHIHAIAQRHRLDDHPLRHNRHLHAVHLAEYGAQASAVHGALLACACGEASMRPGRLVSLRDVKLMTEHVDLAVGHLDVHAECLFADDSGAQYLFSIEQCGRVLASGRVAVIYAAQ